MLFFLGGLFFVKSWSYDPIEENKLKKATSCSLCCHYDTMYFCD